MGTMKRGREEEEGKSVGPLFPRLHVSEAVEKGGPRAPPRNKMALYEQLSMPSHRLSASTVGGVGSAVASTSSDKMSGRGCVHLALPSTTPWWEPVHWIALFKISMLAFLQLVVRVTVAIADTFVNFSSAARIIMKGCGYERTSFSPFYVSPHPPARLSERIHSRSSDYTNPNTTRMEFERSSIKHADSRILNATTSVAEHSSSRAHADSRGKNFSRKKVEHEDGVIVHTYSSKGTAMVESERPTPFCTVNPHKSSSIALNPVLRFPCSSDKPPEKTTTIVMKSIKYIQNNIEEKPKENSVFQELSEKPESHRGRGEKSVLPSNIAEPSLAQEKTFTSNTSRVLWCGNAKVGQESRHHAAFVGSSCLSDTNAVNCDTSRVINEPCPQESLGNIGEKLNLSDKGNKQTEEEEANESFETGDTEKNDEISESSMFVSIQGMEITPDDVVETMGSKHFWEARRAIIIQQRIFAVQVFELHRLIKVQKLIATSPHLLLQANPCLSTSPRKVPAASLQIAIHKDEPHQASQNIECPKEITVASKPILLREEGLDKGLPGQVPRSGAFSGNPPAVPVTPPNKASSWCVHPPQNQWLIPVLSPSEGLVYKPYTGPCPPTGAFLAPMYGSCAPLSLPPVAGDFTNMNMSSLSGAHPNYFGTGLPLANPIMSASAVEQVSAIGGSQPQTQAEQHSRSSCNMPNPNSEAFSGYTWNFQASKVSELQGSTASSHYEKAPEKRDTLPLFPMAQTFEGSIQPSTSCGRDNLTRVIKVVPRNARSATESAARIFQSIQEERRQYGS